MSNDKPEETPDDKREFIIPHGPRKGMKVSFSQCENFSAFRLEGGFIHNLDYVDDPLLIEAAEATLDMDEGTIVSKKPATLSGYLLYNAEGEVEGFICFDSQVAVGDGQ